MRNTMLLLLIVVMIGACQSDPPSIAFEGLPAGDAGSGEKIFLQSINDAPSCASCHEGVGNLGPELAGYGAIAGERVTDQSAEEYTYWSIVQPSRYVVQGFSNVMYTEYNDVLNRQDIADLIAYVLEQ